ncbi:MAG: hypothetical protein WCR54_08905 [Clostridia bacterium]
MESISIICIGILFLISVLSLIIAVITLVESPTYKDIKQLENTLKDMKTRLNNLNIK